MDLNDSMFIAAAGMKAQGERLRVISENLANADSVGEHAGADPYRRKTISFKNTLNKELGVETVQVDKIGVDRSDFGRKYDPGNPAADKTGYVSMPNVNSLVELTDMREAERSYEANLKTIDAARTMLQRTIDILKS